MFDIGWTEMLVIAIVMIVVVGPKDLPKMLRTFGKTTAKMRAMAGDFQRQFNEALKEAELDGVKKSVDELRSLNPASTIRKHLNPFEQAASDVKAGLDTLKSPGSKPAEPTAIAPAADAAARSAEPASPAVHAAEPLKNGATAMPGVTGPEAMPAAPLMTPLNGAASSVAAATPAAAAKASAEATSVKRPAAKKAAAKAAAKAADGKPATKSDESKAARPATRPKAAAANAKTPAVRPTRKSAAVPAASKKADVS